MNRPAKQLNLIRKIQICLFLLCVCNVAQAQEMEQVQELTENVGETLKQVGENEVSIGIQLSYLGTYDDVSAVNGKSGSNSDEVISVDGEPKGAYFIELTGSKKEAGFQNLRYENSIQNPDTDLDRVNPLNARGSTSKSLESKKEAFQVFSTELAPLQGVPNLVVHVREEHLISKVTLKSDIDQSFLPLSYVPYSQNETSIPLTPGSNYYFESQLEEIVVGYYFNMLDMPVKLGWFDMVYMKPVLIVNEETIPDYNIYMPRFAAQGFLLEIHDVSLSLFDGLGILLDLGFRSSHSGTMQLRDNLTDTEKTYLSNESDISIDGGFLKMDLDWKGSFRVILKTQFLAITQKSSVSGGSKLISLDAINTVAASWAF